MKKINPDVTKALSWVNAKLQINEQKVENLGNGLAYCLLINSFYPTVLHLDKVNVMPKNMKDYRNNLKVFADSIHSLKWLHIKFDIIKVISMNYIQNSQLLLKLYKQLNPPQLKQSLTNFENQANMLPKFHSQQSAEKPIYIGLATPLKIPDNGSLIVEKIKQIVKKGDKNDREKVKSLKNLLEIEVEEKKKGYNEEKDVLLSDQKEEQVIVIDDS